jgi:hypothetical protein
MRGVENMGNEVIKNEKNNLQKIITKAEKLKDTTELTKEKVKVIKDLTDFCGDVIKSDDKSSNEVYDIIKKAISSNDKLDDFRKIAEKAISDNNKILENPSLPDEERKEILDRNYQILEYIRESEKEQRKTITELTDKAIKQDEKNKEIKENLVKIVCGTIVFAVLGTAGAVGIKCLNKK